LDDQRTNNLAKSIDINANYVLSLMTQGGAANKPVLCVHDRRRPLESDSSKRTKKMKLFSTTVPGAREARFSADGKHVLVLVEDGRDSETNFGPMGRSAASSQYKSSSIKIFSIDGAQQSANPNIPKLPITSIHSKSMIINWQQEANGDDGDPRIIGFTKELDCVDRVHQINFHRWRYSLSDDDDDDMFKDIQATSDLGNETHIEHSENSNKSNQLEAFFRDVEEEAALIRKSNQYGIQITQEIAKGAVIVKFTTNTGVKVTVEIAEGYPISGTPNLLSAVVPPFSADEQNGFKKDLEQIIKMRIKNKRYALESIYNKLTEVVRSLRNSASESISSMKSETLRLPTSTSVTSLMRPGPTFSKHEMKNAPFPARCGTCWSSDKLVVWANKKVSLPAELPIIQSQNFNIKRHSVTAEHGRAAQLQGYTYQYFFNLAQPKLGEPTDHSPRSRVPYLRNIGLTRQGSIDGRQVQNLQKYPPLRVELHSIAPLTNLSRSLAKTYSIPTISENMAIIQPSEIYRLDDVFRIEMVKRHLEIAKAHIKSISDESFSYSVIVWSTLRTILQFWQNSIEKSHDVQEENLFHFKFYWLPNAKMILEKMIATGDKKIETQTLAVLAAFLSSVPYFEDHATQEINQKSLASLLKLSTTTIQILHAHVRKYSKILNSWNMYFERTKLEKSIFAEKMIQSHLTDKVQFHDTFLFDPVYSDAPISVFKRNEIVEKLPS